MNAEQWLNMILDNLSARIPSVKDTLHNLEAEVHKANNISIDALSDIQGAYKAIETLYECVGQIRDLIKGESTTYDSVSLLENLTHEQILGSFANESRALIMQTYLFAFAKDEIHSLDHSSDDLVFAFEKVAEAHADLVRFYLEWLEELRVFYG